MRTSGGILMRSDKGLFYVLIPADFSGSLDGIDLVRAISDFIREMYAMNILETEISRITESVIPAVNDWRSRPLETVYPFVFLDCMHYKVRQNGTVESRCIYNILGI